MAGIAVLLVMVLVWRKMEKKDPIKLSGKNIAATLIGIVGIVILLCLVPFVKGLK